MPKYLSLNRLLKLFADLYRDRRGSLYMLSAFALPVIIGFGGMGLDVAMWYAERRATQSIADAAAVAATYEQMKGGDLAAMTAAAEEEAIRNGYQDAAPNTISVQPSTLPPISGTSEPIVDVLIRREVPIYMLGFFLQSNPQVAAMATGGLRNLGVNCVIALHETASRAVEFTGTADANVGCGVASNSSSSEALYIAGTANLAANPAQAHGDILVAGGGTLNSTLPPMTYAPRVPDPFGDRVFPPVSGACDYPSGLTVTGALTIGPAVAGGSVRICGDLTVQPSGNLHLNPGTYYVDGGDILIQGDISGTDVTLVLTGDSPGSVGTIDINATATTDLNAPATGPFSGIAIYQDRIADSGGTNKLNGGADMIVNGGIYLKNKSTEFAGGASTGGCTVLVADKVKFVGDSNIQNDPTTCGTVGLSDSVLPTQQQVVLMQ